MIRQHLLLRDQRYDMLPRSTTRDSMTDFGMQRGRMLRTPNDKSFDLHRLSTSVAPLERMRTNSEHRRLEGQSGGRAQGRGG